MKSGIIKIGDIVKFTDTFISEWMSLGLISEEDESWWHDQHIVTEVGYEDNEEYVILDNDENTYTSTSDDNFIIIN